MVDSWVKLLSASTRSMLAFSRDSWSIYERVANTQAREMLSLFDLGLTQSCRTLSAWSALAENFRLNCKARVALVAGADCIEGQVITSRLAEAGYRVWCTHAVEHDDRSNIPQAVFPVRWVGCDLSDYDACITLSRRIAEEYGGVDVVVNCVGGSRPAISAERPASFPATQSILSMELDQVFNVTRSFLDGMIAQRFGRIISILPVEYIGRGTASSAQGRAAVVAFSRSLALELVDAGITVNSVSLRPNLKSATTLGAIIAVSDSEWRDQLDDLQRVAGTVLSLAADSSSLSGVDVHVPARTLM